MQDDELWLTEPFTKAQAWVDLLINANHAENHISIRGNLVKIERGQLGWSELTMGKRWKWSRGKVKRYLELLKDLGRISIQQDRHITSIVTICNYSRFQDGDTTNSTTGKTTDRQQTGHKQECKEEKEVKKQHKAASQPQKNNTPYSKFAEWYTTNCPYMTQLRSTSWTPARKQTIRNAWNNNPDPVWWEGFFKYCGESRFLNGVNDRKWKAGLFWLLKPEKFAKINEGDYHRG
jgi:hypothetical protein